MDKLIIDFNILARSSILIEEYLVLLAYKEKKEHLIKKIELHASDTGSTVARMVRSLEREGYIRVIDDEVILSSKTDELFQAFEENTKLIRLAEQIRELFPKGKKGGKWPWRSSVLALEDKLKKCFNKYGSFTDEEVLEATRKYINSFNDYDRDERMSISKYFILKDNTSILIDCIESIREGDDEEHRRVVGR